MIQFYDWNNGFSKYKINRIIEEKCYLQSYIQYGVLKIWTQKMLVIFYVCRIFLYYLTFYQINMVLCYPVPHVHLHMYTECMEI